jgi:flavin-dependent dehydrogenase
MFDIAIIGLGPAGATLARLLSGKYKTIAIDRKNSRFSKCCGGLLSPDAQKILARFDICLSKEILSDPQIFSVKTLDFDNGIEKFYQRFYVNMNREKFDNFLISLIPDNVEICGDSVCIKIEREEEHFKLKIKNNGNTREIKSKIVIGADGASSIVRKTFYRKNKIKRYTAVQQWFEDKSNSPFYSCIFDRKITDSYCWTISKNNNLIIGGAFPVKDCMRKFESLKEKIKEKGIHFENSVKKEVCFVYFNKSFSGTCTGKNGAYLIGEAAGMISPSSLEGISYSMESARILSEILNKDLKNAAKKYYLKTLTIRLKLIIKILKMPFMYNKLLRLLIMKSGLMSIKK